MANQHVGAREQYVSYLNQAIDRGDTNHDGLLSREEFDAYRKSDKDPSHQKAAAFVDKHFGTLSLLSTDELLTESGITRSDIEFLGDDSLARSRERYQEFVSKGVAEVPMMVGMAAGLGVEAADIAYTGGVVTGCAVVGSAGYAAYTVYKNTGKISPVAMLGGASLGTMWGPAVFGLGAAYLGHSLGDKIGASRFDSKYKPEIEKMLKDLQ